MQPKENKRAKSGCSSTLFLKLLLGLGLGLMLALELGLQWVRFRVGHSAKKGI